MSQMLVPYNNAMRLGQGFNSYTQQICLDHAVLECEPPKQAHLHPKPKFNQNLGNDGDSAALINSPSDDGSHDDKSTSTKHGDALSVAAKPEIVTYSSRFVDKLSDVTDSMNVSGSLSIKTATIGGKANGSYIDSDEFKSSDINLHLQVKATNQVLEADEHCIFNKIAGVEAHQFPEVYGVVPLAIAGNALDCFISGSLTSRPGLEGELSTPTLSGKVEAEFSLNSSKLTKETETTINVYWSGGGSIKDPTKDWTITTLKAAAAAFPERVAVMPQRMYSLASVQPLPKNQTDAKKFNPNPVARAAITTTDSDGTKRQAVAVQDEGNNSVGGNNDEQPPKPTQFPIFSPTFAGLIQARKVCRFEMAKIVNEVDLVAKDPKLSTDMRRDAYFLHPLVFEQLLPDPNAALLLGYVAPVEEPDALLPVFLLESPIENHDLKLQRLIQKVAWKAPDYILQGCAGVRLEREVRSQATLINDLEDLDGTFRPSQIAVWSVDHVVHGLKITYAKGSQKTHGTCDGAASHTWTLGPDGSEIIDEPEEEKEEEKETTTTASGTPPTIIKTHNWTRPEDDAQWSLRGFFTFTHASGSTPQTTNEKPIPVLTTLGVVWGKDTFAPLPSASLSSPICKSFLGLSPLLQSSIHKFKALDNYKGYADKFLLGKSVSATSATSSSPANPDDVPDVKIKCFNVLDDIDIHWTLRSIAFASKNGKLAGLRVTYANGQVRTHGTFENEAWKCEVGPQMPLIVAKLIAGKTNDKGEGFVNTVEFIRGEAETLRQPAWPLDVSTLRYLGEAGSTREDYVFVALFR
ncbi:hypothetical protein B0H63DRAFT_565665 [Podospora didyma]|uniref:Uncharacterized protein n=1 Tax=Podospora didyma TaxID=330526 RepID=A0AAE0K190_9PEZI|nr:hypothetical protein B0H63DRAFT_565665 [Podospora didyma]